MIIHGYFLSLLNFLIKLCTGPDCNCVGVFMLLLSVLIENVHWDDTAFSCQIIESSKFVDLTIYKVKSTCFLPFYCCLNFLMRALKRL